MGPQDPASGGANCRRRQLPSVVVKPAVAIAELEKLKVEAAEPLSLRPDQAFASWKSRVEAVLTRSLGANHQTTKAFKELRYTLSAWSSPTPDYAWTEAFIRGVHKGVGLIDAAIYELQLLAGGDEPVDQRSYDPELWEHVRGLVDAEEWGKVASQTAIFVEARVRTWTGVKGKDDEDLVARVSSLPCSQTMASSGLANAVGSGRAGACSAWASPRR